MTSIQPPSPSSYASNGTAPQHDNGSPKGTIADMRVLEQQAYVPSQDVRYVPSQDDLQQRYVSSQDLQRERPGVKRAPGTRSRNGRSSLNSRHNDFEGDVMRNLKQLEVDMRNYHLTLCKKLDFMFRDGGGLDTKDTRSNSDTESNALRSTHGVPGSDPRQVSVALEEKADQAERWPTLSELPRAPCKQPDAANGRRHSKSDTCWSGKYSFQSFNTESQKSNSESGVPSVSVKDSHFLESSRRTSNFSGISGDSHNESIQSSQPSATGAKKTGQEAQSSPRLKANWSPDNSPRLSLSNKFHSPPDCLVETSPERLGVIPSQGGFKVKEGKEAAKSKLNKSMSQRNEFSLKAWNFFENPESSMSARVYDMIGPYCLFVSVAFTLLQTLEPPPFDQDMCRVVDLIIDCTFLMEVIVRYGVSPKQCLKFFTSPLNVIDVFSVIPLFFRIACIVSDEDYDQDSFALCLVAILRLIKVTRRFQKIHLLFGAFQLAFEALPVLMFTLSVVTLIFSSVVYLVEPRDNIDTLPRAIYFTLVTITSLGYGDIVPQSTIGTCIVTVLVVTSVLYMAMPLGIVGHAFTRVWEDRDRILLIRKTKAAMLQWGYGPHDMPMLFQIFDSHGEGELDITDFRKMITAMRIGLNDKRICELFHSFDKDGNGFVNDREMVRHVFPFAFHEVYSEMGSEAVQSEHMEPAKSIAWCVCGYVLSAEHQYCGNCGTQVLGTSPVHSEIHQYAESSELPGVPELCTGYSASNLGDTDANLSADGSGDNASPYVSRRSSHDASEAGGVHTVERRPTVEPRKERKSHSHSGEIRYEKRRPSGEPSQMIQ